MIRLERISRTLGNSIIKNNHYSNSFCPGTKHTLGVFYNDKLSGVIQLGSGVQPKATSLSVNDTNIDEFLELNRLWLSDSMPKFSESKTISLMIKWIKQNDPKIKWIVSFADGMMGKVGTIYQATNFVYTGYNKSGGIWLTKDGERIHTLTMQQTLGSTKRDVLEEHYGKPLYRIVGGQFRYYYFIDKKYRKKLKHKQLPYPKKENLKDYIMVKKDNWVKEDLWDEFQQIMNRETPTKYFF